MSCPHTQIGMCPQCTFNQLFDERNEAQARISELERERDEAPAAASVMAVGREAYRLGYNAGHDDTVEGRATSAPEERWDEDRQLQEDAGATHEAARVARLTRDLATARRTLSALDCRYTGGGVADVSGSHCPLGAPCERCAGEKKRDEVRAAALHEAAAVLRGLAREYIARHGGGGDYCAGVFDAASRIEALTTTTNRSEDVR